MNLARTIIPAALFACALAACGVVVPEDLKASPKPNRDGKTVYDPIRRADVSADEKLELDPEGADWDSGKDFKSHELATNFDWPRFRAAPTVSPEERQPVDVAKYLDGAHITDPPPEPSWQRPDELTSKYRAIMRSSSTDNELRRFFEQLLADDRVGIDRSRTIREVKMKTGSAGDLSDVIVGGTKGETLGADGEILERLRDEIRGMRGE